MNPADLESWAAASEEDVNKWIDASDAGALTQAAKPSCERLNRLADHLKDRFLGREQAVEAVIDSMIAQVPVVVLGPPGTAKSRIVRDLAKACGLSGRSGEAADDSFGAGLRPGGYFEYLLSQHTMPEELFGAPDLEALKSGQFMRKFQGMLPQAEVAFLDEVFRGGSHILNTLLALLNERIFHDGKHVHRSPLIGIVAAANFPPHGEEAAALYDRFPIRVWVDSVFEAGAGAQEQRLESASTLVKLAEQLDLGSPSAAVGDRLACINDFRIARHASLARHREFNNSKQQEPFLKLYLDLRDQIDLSDRSLWQIMRVAAAREWRENGEFEVNHLQVFEHVAGSPDQRELVRSAVRRAVEGASAHGHA